MFTLTSDTQKSEFLQFLSQSASFSGVLVIIVDGLPTFLNSPVSFTIFSYQISNYPRNILWKTNRIDISDFLESCNVETELIIQEASYIKEEPEIATKDIYTNTETLENITTTEPEKKLNTSYYSNIIEANPSYQTPQKHENNNIITASPITRTFDFYEEIPEINTEEELHLLESNTPESITTQNLLTPLDYVPSALIVQNNTNNSIKTESLENNVFKNTSNLDNFLSRVEKTQSALKEMRQRDKNRVLNEQSLSTIQNAFKFVLPSYFYVVATGTILVSLLFSAFFLFPTQAYTLELNAQQKEASADIVLTHSDFNKRQATFTVSVDADTSGTTTIQTDRSKGKVRLVSSGRSCSITNGSFYVLNNGRYYRHIQDDNLPATITIPENSSQTLSGVEVDVVAEESGAEYNLGQGAQFSITNLRRGNVGSSCYAIASTEIKNTEISGKKVFTKEDSDNLQALADGEIAIKRLQEVTNLVDDKAYIDDQGSWFKNLEEKESFSREIGQEAETVSLTKTVTTDVYYLTRSIFTSKLQQKNKNIQEITDLVMNSAKGSVVDNQPIVLSVFYKYKENNSVYPDEVQKMIQEGSTTEQIKQKYPTISNIQINKSGVSIPGIDPRINVEIRK